MVSGYYGLNQNSCVEALTPINSECDVLGDKTFKEVIKVKEVTWMGPNPI